MLDARSADAALLNEVAAITAEAGRIALGRMTESYQRWDKVPGHPVCEVDIAIDAFLREHLSALAPDAAWLSEETADDPVRLSRPRVWIVDPIDGTRDFLRQRSGWSVSVALIEDGEAVLGVLSAPARGELWQAARGEGATRNGERLQVADRAELAGSRTPIDTLPKADADLVAVHKPNSIALRIALIASGDADLIASTRVGSEWDIAAAVLIASEAGARVTDATGAPFAFNRPDPAAHGVIACAPGIYAAARARFGA